MKVLADMVASDRVLVFAPHPDDETLVTGELIQSALATGAAVRVVCATYGERNPWPQRWIEHRWRIGPTDRTRWGMRRRDEALAALATLGVNIETDVHFMGWPDQGLTDLLMSGPDAVSELAAQVASFAPTLVVMPTLHDRHPDHSALHVMGDLAMLQAHSECTCLGFVVHGEMLGERARVLALDPARQQRKQAALLAHASQITLSRRRLANIAIRPERYQEIDRAARLQRTNSPVTLRIPLHFGWCLPSRRELLLMWASRTEVHRFRAPLARPVAGVIELVDRGGHRITARWSESALEFEVPFQGSPTAVYAKIHRTGARLFIFDREPWRESVDLVSQAGSDTTRPVAVGLS